MICPKCSSRNADGAKFCNECGSNISAISHESGLEPQEGLSPRSRLGGLSDRSIGDNKTLIRSGHHADEDAPTTGAPLQSRYEFLGEIGRGGFATVCMARDKKLGRTVAIKRLLSEHLNGKFGQQVVERFRREAQSIAKLNHLNIVTVYDHDCDGEGYYIVMEYVDGGSLKEFLKSRGGKISVPMAVRLIRGVAQGLAYAHRMNLVHRDVKPANILLSKGAAGSGVAEDEALIPKLVDFGLARGGMESDVSLSGFGMGTPFYAAPEQRRDAKNVNHTADIYSLGKTLYEMVTGEIPDSVDPEAIPPPPELAKIIIKCLKPNPGDRYFSADEVIVALASVEGRKGASVAAGPAKKSGTEEACPSCGTVNPKEMRFCQGCGGGLIRPCPECGRELRVQAPYCGACGTDVAAFLHVQDIADRIGRYRSEKKYSRVLKEYEQLAELGFVPRGQKAAGMIGDSQAAQAEAKEAEAEKKRLTGEIKDAWEKEAFDRIEVLLRQYKEANGALEEAQSQLWDRLPVVRQICVLKRHAAELAAALERRDWAAAQALFTKKPSVPEAADPQDKEQVDAYLAQVSSLYATMSSTLAGEHAQMLKRLRAEIRAAIERAQWARAWEAVTGIPPFSEMLLGGDRAELVAQTADVQSLGAVITDGWLQELSAAALRSGRDGNWDEAQRKLEEIKALPVDEAARGECRRRLSGQLDELHIGQLRQAMREALSECRWVSAEQAAAALQQLAPDDEEARQATAAGEEGKRRDNAVFELMELFKKGLFQKCVVQCDSLIQEVGAGYDLARAGFAGPLVELREKAAQRALEQAAQLATLNCSLVKHEWEDAIRQAGELLKAYPWMREAKEVLSRASAMRRRARTKKIAAVGALAGVALLLAWGVFLAAGYLKVRMDFYSAVSRGDNTAASKLAAGAFKSNAGAKAYLACTPLREACEDERRLAVSEGGDASGAAEWAAAEGSSRQASQSLAAGRFEQAQAQYAAAVAAYRQTVVWCRRYKELLQQRRKEAQDYEDILKQQDTAKLARLGGDAWVNAQKYALEGREPQTDPVKIGACAERMRKASVELLAAVANVKAGEERERREKVEAEQRLQTAWEKDGKTYRDELAKLNAALLERYGGEEWMEVVRLAEQGERPADPAAGCKAYEEALARLPKAAAAARERFEAVKEASLQKYVKVKGECQKLYGLAVESVPETRAGYEAAEACRKALEAAADEKVFDCLADNPAEQASVLRMREEIQRRVDSFYRGPNPQEPRWAVPEFGLQFVWVPALDAWVGQTEVSNESFRHFRQQHSSGDVKLFKDVSFKLDKAVQPAVRVTFQDGVDFAVKVNELERRERRIPSGYAFRLLTDSEWTACARCGAARRYPWGDAWPPQGGNYADATMMRKLSQSGFSEYDDGWETSAPVGVCGTNAWGLCDVGGNVKEWALAADGAGVVRDASWRTVATNAFECAHSEALSAGADKALDIGFRLILARRPGK